jgi:hypothetical protein
MTIVRSLGLPAALFLTSVACSVPQARIGIDAPPEDQFPAVGEYLDHRCGSLDCHGQPARNLRIWGCWGMRFDADAASGCIAGSTTPDEYHATYRSLVGLEPAVMSAVVESHATNPDLLTFVRKAKGVESHKGGHLITPGDDQDTCIVSWLVGMTNTTACSNALLNYPTFLPEPAPTQVDASSP